MKCEECGGQFFEISNIAVSGEMGDIQCIACKTCTPINVSAPMRIRMYDTANRRCVNRVRVALAKAYQLSGPDAMPVDHQYQIALAWDVLNRLENELGEYPGLTAAKAHVAAFETFAGMVREY